MAYATQQDLVDRFGEQELIERSDRSDPPQDVIDAAVVAAALSDAEQMVDGYAATGNYALPLSPVPDLVKRLTCDIARYYLHKDTPSEAVRAGYDDALKILKDVAAGRVKLQAAGTATPSHGGDVLVSTPGRTFTHESLKDFAP